MILPRTTMIGLGLSAASLATGAFLTETHKQPKGEWGDPPKVHLPGAALAGAGFIGTVGFGLGSSMPGMRPVGGMVAALLGATVLGFGIGSLVRGAQGE
ncbi:MAG: hypothetical protein JWM25_936 [Thermoleophilia bacterium]|nr:hypothetical protein [Thermoleophilia bacterium]MCZ4496353.1 hypothetical protein [Thermoleophilia bacterium]